VLRIFEKAKQVMAVMPCAQAMEEEYFEQVKEVFSHFQDSMNVVGLGRLEEVVRDSSGPSH